MTRTYNGICILLLLIALGMPSQAYSEEVDITAYGDSAFIAGNKLLGNDNNHLISRHLRGLESIRSSDINLMNLEATIADKCTKVADKKFSFIMTSDALAEFLKWGMNFIALSNNHSMDCIEPYPHIQIETIMGALQTKFPDMRYHGLARNSSRLSRFLATRTIKGVSIGMISVKGWDNGAFAPLGNLANRKSLFLALKKAKLDIRVMSLHGGTESTRQPGIVVADVAREFIHEYDGDVVFAHHPHVMQGVEVIAKRNGRAGIIFYSLGNALHNGLSMAGDGMVAKIHVGKNGINPDKLFIYPLKQASYNPRPFRAHELSAAIAEIEGSSSQIPEIGRFARQRVQIRFEPVSAPAIGIQIKKVIPGT